MSYLEHEGRKSTGVDNFPEELIKGSREEIMKVLTIPYQKMWATKQWPQVWMQSLETPQRKEMQCKSIK